MATTNGGGGCVHSCRSSSSSGGGRPSWLQATLADLDEKIKDLSINLHEEDDSDTFAERAENYYLRRPLLLTLLQDLHNAYLALADRYCHSLTRNHHRRQSSQVPSLHSDMNNDDDDDSDAESSLSYQTPSQFTASVSTDSDVLVAELVTKTVDYELLLHELGIVGQCQAESTRKIELQRSLLEVLESERLILLNENARLTYQVTTLVEENKGLTSDSAFMKRKASELARCILKLREGHRVSLLSRRIEDLQEQINGLEKRNKEYYEKLVKREEEEQKRKRMRKREVALEVCFEVEKLKIENERLKEEAVKMMTAGGGAGGYGGRRVFRLWNRVKKFDVMLCGSHV